jgi:hypothetical protein
MFGDFPALVTNIRQGVNWLFVTNTLSYLAVFNMAVIFVSWVENGLVY